MKLKFRAEAKDIKIFVVFAVLLFYLVAIAILNITSFVNDATLHGFNPLPIFTAELLPPAIIFYFATLIMIMLSVKSYFFEREKGFGIQTGKKEEKGYSRWCKDSEMKKSSGIMIVKPKDDNIEKGGIPIYNDGKEIWVDTSGYHNMIIGSTGSGKSQSISFPFINIMAKAGESMIVTDPKGELYEGTAKELKKRGYNIILLNFREPQKGNCWNPFSIPYQLYQQGNKDKAIELLEDLAKNILYDENNKGQDPFWENTSADYFAGLAFALFQDAKEEEININSINYMASVGEKRINGSNYMKEYFSTKSPTSTESIKVNATISAPNDTKGSILSVFNQKIQLFSSRESLSEMLSHSDFSMEDIGRNKTAVFIVIQDEKKTYHSLVTIFLKQCYETLVRVAQENPGGKLKYRTNFLLDEFANMPPLSHVDAMVSAARSRNIKLSFIIQNFSQLNDVYGKEKAETIRGNCGNLIYLLSTELAALEEISKMCGEIKSKKEDKTDSRPLITVADLQNFKEEQALVLRSRMRPFKTKLKFDWKIDWGMTREREEYPVRVPSKVQIFDLKAVVDEQIKARRQSMYGNMDPNQMGPGMGNRMPGMPLMYGGGMPRNANPNLYTAPTANTPPPNVDELVKRIDAKLAEIEEEEKREKEASRTVEIKKEPEAPKKEQAAPSNFDIDKLLASIDNRIAELEAEEEAAKREMETKVSTPTPEPAKTPVVEIQKPVVTKPQQEVRKQVPSTPKIEPTVPKVEKPKPEKVEPVKPVTPQVTPDEDYVTDDQFFDDFFSDDE